MMISNVDRCDQFIFVRTKNLNQFSRMKTENWKLETVECVIDECRRRRNFFHFNDSLDYDIMICNGRMDESLAV